MKKKVETLGRVWRGFRVGKVELQNYQKVGVILLIVVIAGFIGWVYEFIVGIIDTGYPYMQGGNFLPWINIYAFGALALIPIALKFRRHPWAVFIMAMVVTGFIELVGGWLVYQLGNGTRYWYYDHGLWLIGNIGGFVCLLSVAIFGIFALILTYAVMPMCIYLAKKMSKKGFLILVVTMFAIVMLDELGNLVLKNLNLPTAMDFWRSLGMKYQNF